MDIEERLIRIIEQAASPSAALEAAAAAIAQDELSDACAVFLAGPEGQLTLWVAVGHELRAARAGRGRGPAGALARGAAFATSTQAGR